MSLKGLIMVGRELQQQHPSELLSGAGTSRERSRRQSIIWTNDGYFTDEYMRHSA